MAVYIGLPLVNTWLPDHMISRDLTTCNVHWRNCFSQCELRSKDSVCSFGERPGNTCFSPAKRFNIVSEQINRLVKV